MDHLLSKELDLAQYFTLYSRCRVLAIGRLEFRSISSTIEELGIDTFYARKSCERKPFGHKHVVKRNSHVFSSSSETQTKNLQ